jgi:uncharacterized membrane protein YeiH
MLQLIELLAVISAAVYGVLLARRKEMDFVGVFSVALVVAFGGGTLRDVLLDRTPLFWIQHAHYPVLVFSLALAATLARRWTVWQRWAERWLFLPDAFGLGLFSMVGAGFALEANTSLFVASLFGVMTGTFGGVIGDIVCNEVPSLFRPHSTLYATCAFVGCWVYLLLDQFNLPQSITLWSGILTIVVLRLIAVRWDLRLPV